MKNKTDFLKKKRLIDKKLVDLLKDQIRLYKESTYNSEVEDEASLASIGFSDVWDEKFMESYLKDLGQPLSVLSLKKIYEEMFKASQSSAALTERVAVLGPTGTYTHLAAQKYFGTNMDLELCSNIRGIFENLAKGEISFGVVPIENSTEGGVGETLSALMDTNLQIYDQVVLNISHSLLSRNQDLGEIKRIYSHPQAHSQCSQWVSKNMPRVQIVLTASTGEAARRAKEDFSGASISSSLAADLFQLNILKENIQDRSENSTRFIILANKNRSATGNDKTSLLFSVKNGPGSLLSVLKVFDEQDLDLTRLESRPDRKKNWEYIFFVDFKGHVDDSHVQVLLKNLNSVCQWVKLLGSYPNSDVV